MCDDIVYLFLKKNLIVGFFLNLDYDNNLDSWGVCG